MINRRLRLCRISDDTDSREEELDRLLLGAGGSASLEGGVPALGDHASGLVSDFGWGRDIRGTAWGAGKSSISCAGFCRSNVAFPPKTR